MPPRLIGEQPLARDAAGNPKVRIGTVFPRQNAIVTLPGSHATQRVALIELLNQERQAAGRPSFTDDEQCAEWEQSVDLIMENQAILIRPDPDNMELAFRADDLLQEIVPKERIKFLYALDQRVRDAVKRRGESWRISTVPRTQAELRALIAISRIGIGAGPIYYYNKVIGTRYLTYADFSRLAALSDADLRVYLSEIKAFSAKRNRMGHEEVGFFMAEGQAFSFEDLAGYDFTTLGGPELRAAYELLRSKFEAAVAPPFQKDDIEDAEWRRRMLSTLITAGDGSVSEEELLGLSAEFFMQVEWLPGGRIEEGELLFDSIFEERAQWPENEELQRLCDEKVKGFVFNLIREFGDLEYVNLGRVIGSLSHRREFRGRRDVYVAVIKQRERKDEVVRVIRMQKWGVREHLEEGKPLLTSIIESEEYTDYILDRRLGCRQLGMNLPQRISHRKISERYYGKQGNYSGQTIWSSYFERDYVRGVATDKVPVYRFTNQEYALRFVRLLGKAAAPNLIVGRCDLDGKVIFDDGDEVVIEDEHHLPADIVVSDHTGTFMDYMSELGRLAPAYAAAANRRAAMVLNPVEFFDTYVNAFTQQFVRIQEEYRKRRKGFDTLFKHRHNEPGAFAYRWTLVLERLNRTDPLALANIVRQYLKVG